MKSRINSFFRSLFLIFTTVIMLAGFFAMPVAGKSVDPNAPQSAMIKSHSSLDDVAIIALFDGML